MFCKKCGTEIADGDLFCGNCGTKVNESLNGVNGKGEVKLNEVSIIKLCAMYFKKPLSFFKNVERKDFVQDAVTLLIGLPVVYGFLNILYNLAFLNSFFSEIKNLPELLAEMKIMTEKEALSAKNEIMVSDGFLTFKNKINAMVDNKEVFFNGLIQVLVIMIATGIILAIINAIILKNKMDFKEILFVSTASYIPLVLSLGVSSLATLLSILFGAFITLSGYALSFITLYSGIKQLTDEKNDKVFAIMALVFIIASAIMSLFILKEVQHSLMTIGKTFDAVKSFI